jgi:hypothetical protein
MEDNDEPIHAALRQRISQLRMQRLKKRKLLLKDQLTHLERQLDPDVLA